MITAEEARKAEEERIANQPPMSKRQRQRYEQQQENLSIKTVLVPLFLVIMYILKVKRLKKFQMKY